METKQIIGFGLVAVAAYLIYENFIAPQVAGTVTNPAGQPAASSGAATTTGNTAASVVAANTLHQIQQKMLAAGDDPTVNHNTDQWNYYYQQVRNTPGVAPEVLFPNADRNKYYSLGEWWTAMQAAGMNGLGAIARHVAPYHYPYGRFANYLQMTGGEHLIKRLN